MINFIKNDYRRVKGYLEYSIGKKIPNGIVLSYYIIVGAIVLPFIPFIKVWCNYEIKKMEREMKELK